MYCKREGKACLIFCFCFCFYFYTNKIEVHRQQQGDHRAYWPRPAGGPGGIPRPPGGGPGGNPRPIPGGIPMPGGGPPMGPPIPGGGPPMNPGGGGPPVNCMSIYHSTHVFTSCLTTYPLELHGPWALGRLDQLYRRGEVRLGVQMEDHLISVLVDC